MSSLIAYFDILGFSSYIRKQTPENIVKIMDTLEGISQFINKVKPLQEKIDTDLSRLNCDLINFIKIDIFNDTILLGGDIPTASLAEKKWDQNAAKYHFADIFLMACSYIVCNIFIAFGLMSRGAIVCGDYQRRSKAGFNAILSSDFIEAVSLEKKAIYPRIIISDSAMKFLEPISNFKGSLIETSFFIDAHDEKMCLDVIRNILFNVRPEVLNELRRAAASLQKVELDDENHRSKHEWFIEYLKEHKLL